MTAQPLQFDEMLDLEEFFAFVDRCRDKRSLTHTLHPYPAKFIPEIPRALLRALGPSPGTGTILDPMCGSGTTLVEATAAGHAAIGIDLNPIAVLAARAKTEWLSDNDVHWLSGLAREFALFQVEVATKPTVLDKLVHEDHLPVFANREKWFGPQVLRELALVLRRLGSAPTPVASVVGHAVFSAAVVGVSNQESETRWCAKPRSIDPGHVLGDVARRLNQAIKSLRDYRLTASGKAIVLRANAQDLPLPSESIDQVITSPPYANSHDYYLYNKLRLFWLGHDVRSVQRSEIGSRNRHSDHGEPIETYLEEMSSVIAEVARVLKPAATATFVVGDAVVRGVFHDMRQLYGEIGRGAGLELERTYGFSHQRLNALFPEQFGTGRKKTTHVLVFRKA